MNIQDLYCGCNLSDGEDDNQSTNPVTGSPRKRNRMSFLEWPPPWSQWIESAPSDEVTVNEVRSNYCGSPTNSINKENSPFEGPNGKDGESTQVSVKVNAISVQTDNHFGSDLEKYESSNNRSSSKQKPIFPLWSRLTHSIHSLIVRSVVALSVRAARNPKLTVAGVIILSLASITTGFFTNFHVNVNEEEIYAPFDTRTKQNAEWIRNESDFPGNVRVFTINIHADGDNVLGVDNLRKVFDAVDHMKRAPGYDEVCAAGDYVNFDDERTCKVMSVTRFFKHNRQDFEKEYSKGGEEAIFETISDENYENLTPVDTDAILGKVIKNEETGIIESAESYTVYFFLSNVDGVEKLEEEMLIKAEHLQTDFEDDDNPMKLEYFSMKSYSLEFARAIQKDLPLLPGVFLLMSGFTCLVFYRKDRVQSRTMLGIGSVVTIVLSLMSSFGVMFIVGVPFTSMTQILPFVVFGVGLDDTFIITGAYFRTDPDKDPVDRIRETMQEVGLSISVTTITTMFAFILGCISSIPAIYWLNLYAFPTILVDFIFQITFFVALIVLDERRIQANRMNCCVCITVKQEGDGDDDGVTDVAQFHQEKEDGIQNGPLPRQARRKTVPERFMGWYAKQLMRTWVKVVVLAGFLAYTGFCAHRATLLTQEFNFSDLLPANSYVKDFLFAMEQYTSRILGLGIYFRGDWDQLDPEMQKHMTNYIDELSALPQLADEVPFCWFRDFEEFRNGSYADDLGFGNMTIQEQVDYAFTIPAIVETYGKHVVRDENGTIISSRCFTYVENLDLKVVKDQIEFLKDVREVTARQPINQGGEDWPFFTHDTLFFIWEFYTVAVEELIFTTITGIAAVCGAALIFFPHWMAVLFIGPMIVMLYVNLLGSIQYAGMHINAVTYVCLVISIGLMVDFIVHVLLRYYESKEITREGKVRDTLETMGASILVGGLSTFLGVLPMSLSTSEIIKTVFISFFAMITLGILYGLMFLPVVLSIFGPTTTHHLNILDGTDDLALKQESDTDEEPSSDDDDHHHGPKKSVDTQASSTRQRSFERKLTDRDSQERYDMRRLPTASSMDRSATSFDTRNTARDLAVLHSVSNTCRDENLEVVTWQSTMAWI